MTALYCTTCQKITDHRKVSKTIIIGGKEVKVTTWECKECGK